MKRYLGVMLAVLVLVTGAVTPVAAQDATYSCGAYGAGDYSSNNCIEDDGGGGSASGDDTSQSQTPGSGSVDGVDDDPSDTDTDSDAEEKPDDKSNETDTFVVAFAKLMSSWGWVVFFGLLLIAGAVLVGWTWRKKRSE